MAAQYDLRDILPHIDPGLLSYQEWICVGMALKDGGYECEMWEDWSRRDAPRYHPGECEKKWASFRGAPAPVTGGTVVQLAREQGWIPPQEADRELDWDGVIGGQEAPVVVDHNWIEEAEVPEPPYWDPASELVRYLEILFEAGDAVGYVTASWQKEEGKYLPTKGCWDRTAGELIQALNGCGGDIGAILGDYNPQAGAWIRFNPLDGRGCKNENVTEYRYALVESDQLPIGRQYAIIQQLELPVAVLVHSGKKSLHAIVRIDAGSYDEYRKRVDYLYAVCEKNGLKIDRQNRNPSRLSRMPGAMRDGRKQYIVAENMGKESWGAWQEWIEGVNDDLPEPESMREAWDNLPDLAPPLIEGVLRQGHKLLLAGPSKAGKSYGLIELCIAIAEGGEWFGWRCAQGKVLYVNLELDRASCLHRFKDVYRALGWTPANLDNIDVWNLRGKSLPMDQLAPKLIRRAAKRDYIAIVIDPIYKVITGDENSADQMARFCNQFDRVATELGCAVIYCHHHSKGQQGQKKSMDRASGSGVFARDPDAMLDMIELEPTGALIEQEGNKAGLEVCKDYLTQYQALDGLSQDALCSLSQTLSHCQTVLTGPDYRALLAGIEAAKQATAKRTAWRIEGTLREFARFEPVNLWFDFPVHHVDTVGSLRDIDAQSEPFYAKGARASKKKAAQKRITVKEQFENALLACNAGAPPTAKALIDYFKDTRSEDTVYRWIKQFGYEIDKNSGKVIRRKAEEIP